MAPRLEFWFDFSCPYAYLASTQVGALAARTGAALVWRPMLLGGVFRALAAPQVAAHAWPEAKNRHNLADMHRWAALWGVPLSMPSGHPMRTVDALRMVLASGTSVPFIHRLFRAYWIEGLDISDATVLSWLAGEAGLDGAGLLEQREAPQWKDALRDLTDEAVRAGIFGAPSFRVNGDLLFWGQDRLEFVERALNGWVPRLEAAASAPSAGG